MSDLADLFPDLPRDIINDFEAAGRAYQADAPLQVGGEQAQVTDDQIAAYLHRVGSLRAPLPPAVSGQQAPPVPEFRAGQGRQAPSPDQSYVEGPDLGGAPAVAEPPGAPPIHQPPAATDTTPLPVTYPDGGPGLERKSYSQCSVLVPVLQVISALRRVPRSEFLARPRVLQPTAPQASEEA